MIKGITVTLYERTKSGSDAFNDAIYTETAVEVSNVLVTPVDSTEVVSSLTLEGKKAVYELCLPKWDTHEWENCRVSFFGKDWIAFGLTREYIEANVPLSWNRKVKVARYE